MTLTALALLAGCATTAQTKQKYVSKQARATTTLVEQSKAYLRQQEILRQRLQKIQTKPAPQPVVPVYDPLANVKVNLDVDNADIQFVLQALTSQAGVNLLIHPTLVHSPLRITLHFNNVSASTVLKQVMRLADLSGRVEDNVLVVRPLEQHVFHMDFMELEHSTHFSSGGDVLGSNSLAGVGGSDSSSGTNVLTGEFRVEGNSARVVNPYAELKNMLDTLVGRQPGLLDNNNVGGAASVAEVGKLSQVSTAKRGDTPFYSLNRMTGTLFVQAKPSVMRTVANLVQRYKKVLGRQIMLEAQILEITLNDDFNYGIDWTELSHRASLAFGPIGQTVGGVTTTFPTNDVVQVGRTLTIPGQTLSANGRSFGSLAFVGTEFAATVSLLKGFGTVKTLSNPTLLSKHGQPSIISVGTSNSFVSQSGSTAISGVGSTISQNIQTSTVFDGLILGVIPFIADNGKVMLTVHPIQSSVDPGSLSLVPIGDTAITLPRVELKELSTQLAMHSGDIVILGGLIDQGSGVANDQVPIFSDIPLLGYLFKKKQVTKKSRELVVVLKVTVL